MLVGLGTLGGILGLGAAVALHIRRAGGVPLLRLPSVSLPLAVAAVATVTMLWAANSGVEPLVNASGATSVVAFLLGLVGIQVASTRLDRLTEVLTPYLTASKVDLSSQTEPELRALVTGLVSYQRLLQRLDPHLALRYQERFKELLQAAAFGATAPGA